MRLIFLAFVILFGSNPSLAAITNCDEEVKKHAGHNGCFICPVHEGIGFHNGSFRIYDSTGTFQGHYVRCQTLMKDMLAKETDGTCNFDWNASATMIRDGYSGQVCHDQITEILSTHAMPATATPSQIPPVQPIKSVTQ